MENVNNRVKNQEWFTWPNISKILLYYDNYSTDCEKRNFDAKLLFI